MESLAALGLASNIVQFVDFASKLVANAKTLYKSAHQTSANCLVLREVVEDITRLSDAVSVPSYSQDDGLQQLALTAKEVARSLLAVLDDLQIQGQKTEWKSFRLAVKEVRSKETVALITNSISILQAQITVRLQLQIKDSIISLSNDIRGLQHTSDRLRLNNTSEFEKLRTDLLGAFNNINISSKKDPKNDERDRRRFPIVDPESLVIGDFHTISQKLPGYKSRISVLSQQVRSIADSQDIIELFYFPNFTTRENKIPTAHTDTFEWIFRGVLPDGCSKIGFPSWLRSGDGIFWVRGKAGSGKSTLMKFISYHPTTLEYLKCWSGTKQLVMGSFYFWYSGTDLQKSQEGLLRSLIFEILRQCPELTVHVRQALASIEETSRSVPWSAGNETSSSRIHAALERMQKEGWTFRELSGILEGLLGHDRSKKFCFIIDGLDEYKAQYAQDQQELVNNLRKLAASPNIKLCVSSRPLTVYMDAFNGDISRCLRLEDLTEGDIRHYTTDKLSSHNQFLKLTQRDPSYSTLVDEVVEKSRGVFLWVFLVVRELLDGLTYNDTIGIMRQRLDSFPATLEEFFQHMFDAIDKIYLPETIRIFQLSASASEPLPMLCYSFLGDVEQVLIRDYYDLCLEHELLQRRDTMQRKLDAWCKGLLELVESEQNSRGFEDDYTKVKVDFLHRSVRDFLMAGSVSALTKQSTYERQRTWLTICKSIILFIRRHPSFSDFNATISLQEPPGITVALDELTYFAKHAQDDGVELDVIHETILQGWGVTHLSKIGTKTLARFLRAACSHGLTGYAELKLLSDERTLDGAILGLVKIVQDPFEEPELIQRLITGAEMTGRPSGVVLEEFFDFTMMKYVTFQSHQKSDDALSIIKMIASTGYKPDDKLIKSHFSQHYTEIMHPGRTPGGRMTAKTMYHWLKSGTKASYARTRQKLKYG